MLLLSIEVDGYGYIHQSQTTFNMHGVHFFDYHKLLGEENWKENWEEVSNSIIIYHYYSLLLLFIVYLLIINEFKKY